MANRVGLVLEVRYLNLLLEVMCVARDVVNIENSYWHEWLTVADDHVMRIQSEGRLPAMALLEYCGYCCERRLITHFQCVEADHSMRSVEAALIEVHGGSARYPDFFFVVYIPLMIKEEYLEIMEESVNALSVVLRDHRVELL